MGSSSDGSNAPYVSGFVEKYYQAREQLVKQDQDIFGNNIYFNDLENKANEIFKSVLISDELAWSNEDPPSVNTLYEKDVIETLNTFKIIQKLPKGAALHLHQDSSATYDYLIEVGTYMPGCYMYTGNDNATLAYGSFFFYTEQPDDPLWVEMTTLRAQQSNVTEFDQQLYLNLTMINKDVGDYIQIWKTFNAIFSRTSGLVTYAPIAEGYLQHMIDQMIADNIQHVELRKPLGAVYYNLNGTTYNDTWYVQLVDRLVQQNRVTYNISSFTVKLIGSDFRHSPKSLIMEHMELALNLRNEFPEYFIGYDLVGAEDEGYPLLYYIDQFAAIYELGLQREYPLDYYFHAGETIDYNNTNLYDAILLNSRRIGHGFSVERYPVLVQLLIEKNIGLEINPISNQVLQYYTNIRSHPVASLMNMGVVITISSDDPAIYNYSGISLDFFEVVYSAGLNLKQVKQLCINSLEQSGYYDNTERQLTFSEWEASWYNFINYIIENFSGFESSSSGSSSY